MSTFNKAPKYHNGLHLKYWLGLICVRWGRHRNGFRSRQTKDIEICGTRREAWLEFNYGLVTEELVWYRFNIDVSEERWCTIWLGCRVVNYSFHLACVQRLSIFLKSVSFCVLINQFYIYLKLIIQYVSSQKNKIKVFCLQCQTVDELSFPVRITKWINENMYFDYILH